MGGLFAECSGLGGHSSGDSSDFRCEVVDNTFASRRNYRKSDMGDIHATWHHSAEGFGVVVLTPD